MSRLPRLVGMLLVMGSVLLLAGDVVQVTRGGLLWTILLALAFVCFAAGLLLLPVAFSWTGRPLVVLGTACAFVGCFAGASMQTLFRVWEVLQEAGRKAAVDLLQGHTLLSLSTLVPGILFPLGLLILATGLLRGRLVPLPISILLAVGAILFPIGHAAGFVPALLLGDMVLLAAFAGLFKVPYALPRPPRHP